MKIHGLRKKISCVVIFPLIIGIVLTRLAAFLPLYIYYPTILNNYTSRMIENQSDTILNISSLLSATTGSSYVQSVANSINIAGDLMETYLFYSLAVNDYYNSSAAYVSSDEFFEDVLIQNNSVVDQSLSIWKSNPSNKTDNLYACSVFDVIIKPITNLCIETDFISNFTYISYGQEDMMYVHPASLQAYQKINDTLTCYSEETADNPNDVYCNFFNQTYVQKISSVIFTDPYNLTYYVNDTRVFGQSACRGQWNYTTTSLILMYCIDFTLNLGNNNNIMQNYEGGVYSYIINPNGKLLYYYNQTLNSTTNFTYLEFNNDLKESWAFGNTTLKLFENQRTITQTYLKGGEEMKVSITPILMVLEEGANPVHYASVGVVLKKSVFESKFNSLRENCNQMLFIEIYVSIGLFLLLGGACVLLTDKITASVVSPIDHLLNILLRMKQEDLNMDILESYKPSPPEIACLYDVFDKLRVVLRFNRIPQHDLTEASLIYSQALTLFKSFGNTKAMEICYRELGYICFKREFWEEAAEYLHEALILAERSQSYEYSELAKRKAETANAMMKAGVKREQALRLFGDSLETFKKYENNLEMVNCLLDVAESLFESCEINPYLLEYIEKIVYSNKIINKDILMQRYLYMRGLYSLNILKIREAFKYFVSVIEDFPIYLPSIRTKAYNQVQMILSKYLPNSVKEKVPIQKLDVILVVSSTLAIGPMSWNIPRFLKGLLGQNDRISLLQFHTSPQIIYNLTKLPIDLFSLRKCESGGSAVLYDTIIEGIKQLSINFTFSEHLEKRNEWMIIVTDCNDRYSKATIAQVVQKIKESRINVIIINYFAEASDFKIIAESSELGMVFNVTSDESLPLIFKEVEAYLCPFKEVLLSN